MQYQVILDNREDKSVQDAFLSALPQNCTIAQLDVGDIHITYNDKLIIVIERKEINDLASSMNTGRYHEQKVRLKNLTGCRVIYLIEGSPQLAFKKFDNEAFKGVIINTTIRDGMQVITTSTLTETIDFVKGILHRLPKYINELIKEHLSIHKNLTDDVIEYTNAIDVNKRNNNNPKVCFINQLRQVQGISAAIAQVIADNHTTMVELIIAFQDKGKDLIADYKSNNRRIGNVISNRLFEYLGLSNAE